MIDESKIAKGSASGIKLAETKNNNSKITVIEIPFPIKSSMYFHKNCRININIEIQNVTIKGPAKERMLKT